MICVRLLRRSRRWAACGRMNWPKNILKLMTRRTCQKLSRGSLGTQRKACSKSPSGKSHRILINRRNIRRIDASLMNATALHDTFSESLAKRWQRPSQTKVRSTTHRLRSEPGNPKDSTWNDGTFRPDPKAAPQYESRAWLRIRGPLKSPYRLRMSHSAEVPHRGRTRGSQYYCWCRFPRPTGRHRE
jgi:hypothetical protein